MTPQPSALAALQLNWFTGFPQHEGLFAVRGWSLDEPPCIAYVQVRMFREELVCNLHCETSDRDMRQWRPVRLHTATGFEWADVCAAWPTQARGSRIELEWAQDGLEFVCIIPRQEYRVVHSIDEYSGETWRAYFDSYGPEQDGELAEELGVYAWAQDGRAACERHFTNSYQPYTHPSPSTAALREALNTSGNYVADRETEPRMATFGNGRTVRVVGDGYLEIEHATK